MKISRVIFGCSFIFSLLLLVISYNLSIVYAFPSQNPPLGGVIQTDTTAPQGSLVINNIGAISVGKWQSSTPVGISYGGTGSTQTGDTNCPGPNCVTGARTNLTAAASGANSDITSLSPTGNLILTPTGNVGIGITNPTGAKLVIGGSPSIAIDSGGGSIIGVNKITANTFDPIYEINGKKYATYLSDTIGIKTEYFGKGKLGKSDRKDRNGGYSYAIDFAKAIEGSDLWLFWQTIKEGRNMEDVVVMLTPEGGFANLWYELYANDKAIIIYGDKPIRVSYHIVAPRFDADNWSTILIGSKEIGTVIIPKR